MMWSALVAPGNPQIQQIPLSRQTMYDFSFAHPGRILRYGDVDTRRVVIFLAGVDLAYLRIVAPYDTCKRI